MSHPRAPLKAFLDGVEVGSVVDYAYETPWASGRFVARPGTRGELLRKATELSELAEADCTDDEYDAALSRSGLRADDVGQLRSGPWVFEDAEGVRRSATTVTLDAEGWLVWRWREP